MNVKEYNTKKIFKMSLPIFVELILQLLVGNIDQIMISRYSQNSVAAIGNGNQIINIVIIVLNAMSIATTVLCTQYLGSGNKKRIAEVCNISCTLMGIMSIIVSFFIIFFRNALFTWLNVPDEILEETSSYIYIVSLFIFVQGIYMTFTAVLKSFALMKEVMIISLIMNSVNIVGNAVLINGLFGLPALGIVGAAISTDISKLIGLLLVIFVFVKKVKVKISLGGMFEFPKGLLKTMIFVGLPSGVESISYNLSQMYILKFVNNFNIYVIATKVYCSMLANVIYVYSISIAQATQIVVGYLMGSGNEEFIQKRVLKTIFISILVSCFLTVFIYLNGDFIFGIFTTDKNIIELGKQIILVELFLELGRSVNITMVRCLVTVGDVKFPVVACMFSAWVIAVGLGYYFGVVLDMGLLGIWIAMACDECFRGLLFLIRFVMGKWKGKNKVFI